MDSCAAMNKSGVSVCVTIMPAPYPLQSLHLADVPACRVSSFRFQEVATTKPADVYSRLIACGLSKHTECVRFSFKCGGSLAVPQGTRNTFVLASNAASRKSRNKILVYSL